MQDILPTTQRPLTQLNQIAMRRWLGAPEHWRFQGKLQQALTDAVEADQKNCYQGLLQRVVMYSEGHVSYVIDDHEFEMFVVNGPFEAPGLSHWRGGDMETQALLGEQVELHWLEASGKRWLLEAQMVNRPPTTVSEAPAGIIAKSSNVVLAQAIIKFAAYLLPIILAISTRSFVIGIVLGFISFLVLIVLKKWDELYPEKSSIYTITGTLSEYTRFKVKRHRHPDYIIWHLLRVGGQLVSIGDDQWTALSEPELGQGLSLRYLVNEDDPLKSGELVRVERDPS